MLKNTLLAAAAILAVTVATDAARANPIYVGYSLNGGSTITSIGTSGSDGTAGTGGTTVTAGGFSIQISGTGQTAGANTSLFSNTTTVSSTSSGSIILYASEINNTSRAATFRTGFSNDSGSFASVTETSTLGLSNSIYSTVQPYTLSTQIVAPGASIPAQTVAAPGTLPSMYSLTEAYAINFTTAGTVVATLSVTSQAASVPEPVSLAVLGSGLAVLGLVRRKRA